MKNRELIQRLLDFNMDADVLVSIGDTFDDVSDFTLSYGGPDSGDGETKADTKNVYINFKTEKSEERCNEQY